MHTPGKHIWAEYDEQGNVLLHSDEAVLQEPNDADELPEPVSRVERHAMKADADVFVAAVDTSWTTLDEKPLHETAYSYDIQFESGKSTSTGNSYSVRQLSTQTSTRIGNAMREGAAQYTHSAHHAKKHAVEALDSLGKIPARAKGHVRSFWGIANKPCSSFLPRRPRSKTSLFLLDTVRFGGTFAFIFTALFVGINYQSFWQITKSALALNIDTATEQALQTMMDDDAGKNSAPTATQRSKFEAVSLLTYLPKIGPYENRLIIPKIGKNVPIVEPSMDALMKEDWKEFEEDVQESLHHGVVHYPGSASPGNPGNFFITGHSSYYPWDDGKYKDVFARLHELEIGDVYSVYYGGDMHMYKITEKKEVKPTDVSVLDQPTQLRLSTLMTCTPIGTTLRRLVIIAQEIDPATGTALRIGERGNTGNDKARPAVKMEALPI